jgi:hypothetical protein
MTERKKERKERNEVMEKKNKTASLQVKYTSDVCCFHVSGSRLVECKQARPTLAPPFVTRPFTHLIVAFIIFFFARPPFFFGSFCMTFFLTLLHYSTGSICVSFPFRSLSSFIHCSSFALPFYFLTLLSWPSDMADRQYATKVIACRIVVLPSRQRGQCELLAQSCRRERTAVIALVQTRRRR